MKEMIKKIPIEFKVCASVFIIGLITLLIALSSSYGPVPLVLSIIGGIATLLGMISLIACWMKWMDEIFNQ